MPYEPISDAAIDKIRNAHPDVTHISLANELGCHYRTVARYRKIFEKERREQCRDQVDQHVIKALPDDLRRLDQVMETAQERMLAGGTRETQWARCLIECLRMRFDFLGFPEQKKRELDSMADSDLMEIIRAELSAAGRQESSGDILAMMDRH